ncbi:glyoxylase-like metal-dependent hydrolase (beta-lactamase superfamily II) [Humitalea rosea]|uniref:Glyoxylase-like metal-dependent hydrolase (Beta-lactamase superfamily II) n=1 Tax=Humitalea rosea TaxID=990373 RepID=A0A2W7IWT3_9PROT|nr:MBL fold metallo-hydrolase [Humitalea rosea]PZW50380.1 glyoxylase-like metal-dependent hydrolase (beta-lactamase superfamily II) [Humitalea rosea]
MSMDRRSLFAATALGALAAPGLAAAQGAAPTAQAPGFYRLKVGAKTVTVVHDGFAPRPNILTGFVRNATPEQVEASLRDSYMPLPGLDIPFTITFVQTSSGLVVFDTGTGNQLGAPTAGTIAANMRAAGLDPAAVTRVVISHFHGDHITGLTTPDNTPVFPNADLWVPEPEYAYWMDDAVMSRAAEGMRGAFQNVRRRLGPYAAKTERYAAGAEVAPGIRAVATYGHTPGHMSFTVEDGGESLMILSDVTNHSELNLKNPGWHAIFDMDPVLAEATRRRVFDQVATDRLRCIGYHFPFPANGYVAKTEGGYRFIPATWTAVV